MYNQKDAELLNPYTKEQIEQRRHDFANPVFRSIVINDIITGYQISQCGDGLGPNGNPPRMWVDPERKYIMIELVYSNGMKKLTTVHRLVAETFIPNDDPEHKTQVNHKNSNRQDNWVGNLEWVSRSENMQHAIKTGFMRNSSAFRVGEDRPNARHTEEQARQVCEMLAKGMRVSEIVTATGYDHRFVYGILKMGKWKYISKNYDMVDMTDVPKYTDEQIHEVCKLLQAHKSNGEIAQTLNLPRFVPYRVRNGSYREDISSQYKIPSTPARGGKRKVSTETIHKAWRLVELGVGNKEICQILPDLPLPTLEQLKARNQYKDISAQYTFPGNIKTKGIRTGRVKAGTSKSGIVARLGVGYDYDRVVAALEQTKM